MRYYRIRRGILYFLISIFMISGMTLPVCAKEKEYYMFLMYEGDCKQTGDHGYSYYGKNANQNSGGIVAQDAVVKVGDTVTLQLTLPTPAIYTWRLAPVIVADGVVDLDYTINKVTLDSADVLDRVDMSVGEDAWWYEAVGAYDNKHAIRLKGGYDEWQAGAKQMKTSPVGFTEVAFSITINSIVYVEVENDNAFADVEKNSWYYSYVKKAVDKNLMTGKDTDTAGKIIFDPMKNMTRAEFVQTLYNKEGKPRVEYQAVFEDVPANAWFTDAIMWAYSNKIVAGKKELFDVSGNITRQEMATILYKYAANYKGYDTSKRADFHGYADVNLISDWAIGNMQWALHYNILKGRGENLAPLDFATRAEGATMLLNFMDTYGE